MTKSWSWYEAEIARLQAELRTQAAALAEREGWVLVPKELTEAMHVAAVRTIVRCTGNADFPPRVWRALLAAAPSPNKEKA